MICFSMKSEVKCYEIPQCGQVKEDSLKEKLKEKL